MDLWKAQDGLCWWCKKKTSIGLDGGSRHENNWATIDHVVENGTLVMACMKCNGGRAKNQETFVKFYDEPRSRIASIVKTIKIVKKPKKNHKTWIIKIPKPDLWILAHSVIVVIIWEIIKFLVSLV